MDYGSPSSDQLAVLVDRGGEELPIQAHIVGLLMTVLVNERIEVLFKERGGMDEVIIES